MQVQFPVSIHPDLFINPDCSRKNYTYFSFDTDVDLVKPKHTKNNIFS